MFFFFFWLISLSEIEEEEKIRSWLRENGDRQRETKKESSFTTFDPHQQFNTLHVRNHSCIIVTYEMKIEFIHKKSSAFVEIIK